MYHHCNTEIWSYNYRTLNYGKPSSVDLLRFGECLESKSFVMLDGSNSYNEFLENKNCTKKVLISHESYDKFNHLNTVNSFHKLLVKPNSIINFVYLSQISNLLI